jgi:hypothetical protein
VLFNFGIQDKKAANGSTRITSNPQNSIDFNELWDLVRGQEASGSNPLAPSILSSIFLPNGSVQNPSPDVGGRRIEL